MSLERETKPASAGLAVLEEEADALSDASDSGGANPQAHCRTPTQSAGARMSSSKEHTEAGCSSVDLKLGGDASTERPTAASKKLQTLKSVSNVEEEEGNTSQSASGAAAPSAARRAPNANASKRTSMFASFGNMPLPGGLQAKMDELQAQGAEGWASWSKRLANSEAVRGASALLARAERNLGNAMLLDEVHPQHGAGAGTSDGQDAVTSPGSTTSTGTQDANERERAVLRAIGTSPQLRSLRPSSMSLSRSGSGSSAGGKSPRTSRGATATFPRLTSSPQTASGANKSPDFWALDGGLAPYVPTTSGADSPGSSGSMTAASLEGALSGAGFFGMFAQAWKPEGSKDDRTWAHDSSTPNLTSNPMKPGQRRKEKDASHSRSTSAASANSNMTGVSGGGGHSRTRIAAQRATSPSTSLSTSTAPSATKSTTTATSTTTTASTLDVRRASLSSSSSAGNWDWDATDEDKTITLSKSAVLEADAGTDADAGALGRRMDKGDLQKPLVPERVENKSHNLGPRSPPSLTSTASSPTMVQKQEEGEEDEWGW